MGCTKNGRCGPAIVTGAGSGLGRGIALALCRTGHNVMLIGRRHEALSETRRQCEEAATAEACDAIAIDVCEAGAAQEIVSRTKARFGSVGALVNNAAIARAAPLGESREEDWECMLRTNLLAPMALIKAATSALRESCGMVVNIGSIGGLLAVPNRAAYGASKAALHHLTRSLARELAPEVRVNAILPGPVDTPMYDTLGLSQTQLALFRREMLQTIPLGRMGRVDDVAPWVQLLLSAAGAWVTGSVIVVDGGRSC